jgi:sec-independent protein translocase protein TatB
MFDFGVGYTELFVLAIIAAIVIGPKDLPKVLRTFGQFMNKARGMAREFQGHVDQAMREGGVDSLKKDMQDLRKSVDDAGQKTMAPSFKAPSLTSAAQKDFETYFGSEPAPGETRVAGTLVAVEAAKKP